MERWIFKAHRLRKMITRAICLTLGVFSLSANADYVGKVVRVIDGDTVAVLTSGEMKRVRLNGIDAPESKQAFGLKSKQMLIKLVAQKYVLVATDEADRYGRDLGTLILKGQDINAQQVISGMAWAYRYKGVAVNPHYVALEQTAAKSGVGLWSESNPITPWSWRKSH